MIKESGLLIFDIKTRNRIIGVMDFLWNNKYTTEELITIIDKSCLLTDKTLDKIKSYTRDDGSNFLIYNDKVTIMQEFIQNVVYNCIIINDIEDFNNFKPNENGGIYFYNYPIWITADIIKFTPDVLENQNNINCVDLMNRIIDILNIRISIIKKCKYFMDCIDPEKDTELKSMIDNTIIKNYTFDNFEELQLLCNEFQQEIINYTVNTILKR